MTLKCPFCGNLFRLGTVPPTAAGFPPPPAVARGGLAAHSTPPVAVEEPLVTDRPRMTPRKKSNLVGLLLGLAAVVGLVAGMAYLAMTLLARPKVVPQPTTPEAVASQKARQFLMKETLLPATSVFPQEDKVEQLAGGRWIVSSVVDVPARVGNVLVRQPWSADLTQGEDGNWTLDHLKVDRDTIVSRKHEGSEGWRSDLPDWQHRFGAQDDGPDRSTSWAMDRLAEEIEESVDLGPTLVVWLIDRSMSARPQQQEVVRHLDKILSKPNQFNSSEPKLQTAVMSFGSDVEFVLEQPSSDSQQIEQAFAGVEEDTSGQELAFQAIESAVEKYRPFGTARSGYVMFVLVSDEVGDDQSKVDETLALARQHGMTVSVIGVTAPFGRLAAPAQQAAETVPQAGNQPRSLVQQGPESRYLEMIDLGFASGGEAEAMESGYGPFALTYLCQETGGMYYACRDFGVASGARFSNFTGGSRPSFDPQILRRYAPDYVSEEQYRQILASNKACQAVHEAAKLPPADVLVNVTASFLKQDEARFKRALDTAQRDAAKFEPKIAALHDALKNGEADRPNLTRPRWQAAYDLAMGRVLAARARTEGYNAMLAKLKSGGNFTKPENDTWVLQETDTTGAGSIYEKMLEQSRMYLNRVVKDHPGTPWAILAARELQIKSGWQLVEADHN